MNQDNPHHIYVGQEVAVLSSLAKGRRKPLRIAKVARVTAKLFNLDEGMIYRLRDLCGHGHPGKISIHSRDLTEARDAAERYRQETRARNERAESRQKRPGYELARQLNWSTLTDTEIIERWLMLEPAQLQRIVNELEQAGVVM